MKVFEKKRVKRLKNPLEDTVTEATLPTSAGVDTKEDTSHIYGDSPAVERAERADTVETVQPMERVESNGRKVEDEYEFEERDTNELQSKSKSTESRKPKYMEKLIKSARKRRAELQELKAKKMGHLESFTTSAYKAKKEELIEEEEEPNSKDFTMFYKSILQSRLASTGSSAGATAGSNSTSRPSVDSNVISAGKAESVDGDAVETKNDLYSANRKLNDAGELIDKTDALKGGLNFTKRPLKRTTHEAVSEKRQRIDPVRKDPTFIKKQYQQVQTEKKNIKVQQEQELVSTLVAPVNTDVVNDAKARYLARKAASLNK